MPVLCGEVLTTVLCVRHDLIYVDLYTVTMATILKLAVPYSISVSPFIAVGCQCTGCGPASSGTETNCR